MVTKRQHPNVARFAALSGKTIKRKHPNVAWFKKLPTLPQPTGEFVPTVVPLAGIALLAVCITAHGFFLWGAAVALLGSMILGRIEFETDKNELLDGDSP